MPKNYVCQVTNRSIPRDSIYRFVASADNRICFDASHELEGKTLFVSDEEDIVRTWLDNQFLSCYFGFEISREVILMQIIGYFYSRMLTFIAFAKKSGKLQHGKSKIEEILRSAPKNSAIIQAKDASLREKFKIADIPIIEIFSSDELSSIIGAEMVKYIIIYEEFASTILALEKKYKFFNEQQ
ncbi:MAG: hypothetical protein SFT91_04370 [Rickettsiaceae bacterium]|nr:hypothetical protein [Rickettsiaceae bacterium]